MIKEITPAAARCSLASCPKVYEAPDGAIILVGDDLTPQEALAFGIPLGKGERAIAVPRAFYDALSGEGGGSGS